MPRAARAPAIIVAGLFVVTVAVFYRQLFDHWTFPWDFVGSYTTTPAFVASSFGSGHLLSWSPYVASGFPVAVDPTAGMYFPGWWLLGALGVPATLRVLTTVQVAHVLLGSVGVLALARARRLGWPWAALAALAFVFFGGFYGEAEHADFFRGFSYLPWLLWALTPPEAGRRWLRMIVVPLLAWLIVSGAYPGQVVSFGLTGIVYLAVALKVAGREVWRRSRLPLLLAGIASAFICLVVLLPYLRAEHANELFRVQEPTAAVRAGASLAPLDILGLYLNNFAWIRDGTITAWAVGIPILVGLGCVSMLSTCTTFARMSYGYQRNCSSPISARAADSRSTCGPRPAVRSSMFIARAQNSGTGFGVGGSRRRPAHLSGRTLVRTSTKTARNPSLQVMCLPSA
jgi:hypothetical protein